MITPTFKIFKRFEGRSSLAFCIPNIFRKYAVDSLRWPKVWINREVRSRIRSNPYKQKSWNSKQIRTWFIHKIFIPEGFREFKICLKRFKKNFCDVSRGSRGDAEEMIELQGHIWNPMKHSSMLQKPTETNLNLSETSWNIPETPTNAPESSWDLWNPNVSSWDPSIHPETSLSFLEISRNASEMPLRPL